MKGNTLRVYRPVWRGTRRKSLLTRLVSEPAGSHFLSHGKLRTLLPTLFASAMCGLTLASSQAQEAPQPAEKPAAVEATKVAQAAPAGGQAAQPAGQPAQPATPPAPAAPAPGTVTVTGLVDVYYGVNVRAPGGPDNTPAGYILTVGGEKIGVDNLGRAFDINDRTLSLSLGEVNITRTANKSFPLGITATLTFGDTARIVHANEPGGTSSWQTIQQLYFTKTSHLWGRDLTFDFGKFVTPFGIEVIESSSNDNYSRSFGFTYAIPLYHAGLRVTAPLTDKLTLATGLVNGWNNVADDNNGKTVFAQLTWKPNNNFTGILGFIGGPEGTGAFGIAAVPTNGGGSIGTSLGEIQGIWQANSKLKLAVVADHARAAGTVMGAPVSGSWVALAGYARYQFTPKFALAARVEQFEDIPGVGGVGLHFGGYTKLNSFTLTAEYQMFNGHLLPRLEYRHDHSNNPFFGSASGAAVNDQDTYTLSGVYKF